MFEGMTNASELSEKKLPLKDNYLPSNQKLYSARTILCGNTDYFFRMTQDSNLSPMIHTILQKNWVPDEHKEGQTYVRVTNLLQGHIENEIDLNGQASCRKSCEPYNFAKPQSCYKDLFCSKQPACNGKFFTISITCS